MRRRSTGFTLLELLCAIGIIAILASLLVPVLMKGRQRARGTSCIGNLRHIGMALSIYAGDSGGWYPPRADGLTVLHPRYMHQAEAFVCPALPGHAVPTGPSRLPCSYQYQAGLASDCHPNRAIAADRVRAHGSGANVLFGDLRVQWVSGRQLAGEPIGTLRPFVWAHTGLPAPPAFTPTQEDLDHIGPWHH